MTCTLTAVPYSSTAVVLRENLATNPEFQVDTYGWAPFSGATISVGGTGGEANFMAIAAPASAAIMAFQSAGLLPAAAPSTAYRVTAAMGAVPAAMSVVMRVEVLTAANAVVSTVDVPATSGAVPSAVVSTGATGVKVRIAWVTTTAVAGTFYVLSTHIERDATWTGTRFYGDTSNSGLVGRRYAWTGTPNASTSTLTSRTVTAGAITPELVIDYGARNESATVLHEVINRADPVPSLGAMRTRTGSLKVWCSTLAIAIAVRTLYGPGRVVMLRDTTHPELDMYHVATATALSPEGPDKARWVVAVDYAEVYSTAALW